MSASHLINSMSLNEKSIMSGPLRHVLENSGFGRRNYKCIEQEILKKMCKQLESNLHCSTTGYIGQTESLRGNGSRLLVCAGHSLFFRIISNNLSKK